VPGCLLARRILDPSDTIDPSQVFRRAIHLRDSLTGDTSAVLFADASLLTRSLIHISQMYSRGLLKDSVRFHRLVDHVAVTEEVVKGSGAAWPYPKIAPKRTPYLLWLSYPNDGYYFQPASTMQAAGFLFVRSNLSTDSLAALGDALWGYALWRSHASLRFPVWEYYFPYNSGGVTNEPPWISALPQGYALIVYAELYRRTNDSRWRSRAFSVLNSYKVVHEDGGVLLSDTTHGYWWEEFSPYIMIWNGSAQAALGAGELWQATGDSEVKRMFDRSIDALKYYTPFYDTGYWTLYSRTGGYNSRDYHAGCIAIMDAFYSVTGDLWFKNIADRWRSYVPPPGVP
jgi:D-glucuronyl C5-epimerase-like protein